MPLLADYQLEHGLSDDEVADVLNERLGQRARKGRAPITGRGVESMRRRRDEKLPRSWLDALGLELPEREFIASSSTAADEDDGPPAPTIPGGFGAPGAGGRAALPVPVELPFDGLEAAKRIELVYVGVGEGVSRAMRQPQIAVVFRQHAPKLAEKWIAAAKQNARVAQVVTYVTAGGAVGDLVIAHITLVLSLLIVSGKVPVGGIGSLLGPDVVVPQQNGQRQSPPAEPRGGPEDSGAVRAVGDDAAPPSL